jgi:predicted dienelactone hydrolase
MNLAAALALVLTLALAGQAQAANVGFQELKVGDGTDPSLVVGVWYPTPAPASDHRLGTFTQSVAAGGAVAGRALPLVVMSHGTGGWYGSHYDTALALAQAGFVVAAVSHTGDTYQDRSRAAMIWTRSGQIGRVVDHMTGEWADRERVDPRRIGVFGFSSGGFTALVAAGATPDLGRMAAHCLAHPGYFDCALVKAAPAASAGFGTLPASAWARDGRIKAAVVAAPALGFTFGREGLKDVRIPVQLWRAEHDRILPHPDYAEAVRVALPRAAEFHLVAGADHYDFLSTCDPVLVRAAPDICRSPPGFDRAAFHERFNRQVIAFFRRELQ